MLLYSVVLSNAALKWTMYVMACGGWLILPVAPGNEKVIKEVFLAVHSQVNNSPLWHSIHLIKGHCLLPRWEEMGLVNKQSYGYPVFCKENRNPIITQ